MADILIVNRSQLITAADIDPALDAINRQIAGDFAPFWGIEGTVHFSTAPAGAWVFTLADQIDQSSDLGYHVDENGVISAIIDVLACKNCGDGWQQCLSHEVLEALADPFCTRMSPDGVTMVEVCDPCEGDVYDIDGVLVSNFVTPSYFGFDQGSRLDFLEKLTGRAPTLRPGGYIEQLENGQWVNRQGERATGYMATRPHGRRSWRKRPA